MIRASNSHANDGLDFVNKLLTTRTTVIADKMQRQSPLAKSDSTGTPITPIANEPITSQIRRLSRELSLVQNLSNK